MNREFKVKIIKNADLKKYCTFKIGGCAKYLFIAENTYSLIKVCRFCKENSIKFKVIGLGANLVFSDDGYSGAIIVNRSNKVKNGINSITVDSGMSVGSLIQKCIKRKFSGIENLAGIPSTVGGAIVNSLSAFNTNFCDFVEYVKCYDVQNDKILKMHAKKCGFGYRTSVFKTNGLIILEVKLKFKKDNILNIKEHIKIAINRKKSTQPTNLPSAGSVFKRGNIVPAKVIDELGLKGTRVGGAEISTKHAGFIVNVDSATCKDVKILIDYIKTQVFNNIGEKLETEIEFVE